MRTVFLICATLFIFVGCNKDEKPLTAFVTINYDLRLCPCCGGFLVTFEEETKTSRFQTYQEPNDLVISQIDTFPKDIKIAFENVNDDKCVTSDGQIRILEILE